MDIQGLLDTLFLTRQSPVAGLLSQEEQDRLKTQQLIGTGIGVATGLAQNWNKGALGAALGGYTGGVTGRQAPVDVALKNYMTTNELTKMMQDLKLGQFNLKKAERFDAGVANAIKNNPDLVNDFFVNPEKTIEALQRSNPRFRGYENIKADEDAFYGQFNINPANATPKDKADFLRFQLAVPDKDVYAKQVERAKFLAENKGIVDLPPIVSQSEVMAQIIKERSNEKPTSTGFAKPTQPKVQPTGEASTQPQSKPTGKPIPLIDDPNQISDVRIDLKKSKAGDTNLAVKSIQDLNRQERLINDILNSKGFNQAFGFGGATSSAISGSDAAYTRRLLDQLKAKSFVGSIVEMKGDQGSTGFGQLAVSEGAQIKDAQSAVDQTLDPDAARVELTRYLQKVQDAKKNLSQDYSTKYGDIPSERLKEQTSFSTNKGIVTDAVTGASLPTKILQEYGSQIDPNAYYKVVKGVPYLIRKKQ